MVAQELLNQGVELTLIYSRSHMSDQVRAGLAEFGYGVASRYVRARRRSEHGSGEEAISLADWARERGAEVKLHRRLDDADCLASLRGTAPDLVILAGADIVPSAVLDVPRLGTLNAHYGLLPRYRGMNVTEWSIFHDDPVGVSVHWVDRGIDTGAVLIREPIPVRRGERLADLRPKHQQTAARLLSEAAGQALTGRTRATAQRPEGGRQYYRMHPELRRAVESKLEAGDYRWLDASSVDLEEELESQLDAAGGRARPER